MEKPVKDQFPNTLTPLAATITTNPLDMKTTYAHSHPYALMAIILLSGCGILSANLCMKEQDLT